MGHIRETSRTYVFPNNEELRIDKVRTLKVSASGGHRIITSNKTMYYVPNTWIGIKIQSPYGWEM